MASTLNLGTIKTPGVYLDEMSLFPPSVAQVDTAIPAFIGLTRQAYNTSQPVRISSMAEFRSYYGGGPDRNLVVEVGTATKPQAVSAAAPFYLFDSLQLFFSNGGEKCYIVSIGTYDVARTTPPTSADYQKALDALRKFDEPTLIAMPDAVTLGAGALASVQQAALNHCRAMQDRFAILDVQDAANLSVADDARIFRDGVTGNLNYGAAYYPYLQTSLPLTVDYSKLSFTQDGVSKGLAELLSANDTDAKQALTDIQHVVADMPGMANLLPSQSTYGSYASAADKKGYLHDAVTHFQVAQVTTAPTDASPVNANGYALTDTALIRAYGSYVFANSTDGAKQADGTYLHSTYLDLLYDIDHTDYSKPAAASGIFDRVNNYLGRFNAMVTARYQSAEATLRSKSPLYAGLASLAETKGIVAPPSGAIAGIYARTDNERGVWKSPANVGLNYVAGPTVGLTDADQDGLNVDATAGKSINAIRAFSGKGTLVWGARTLAGSDNEWRYVSVRRFFIMAEESIKKATAQFVFEANDANTWVRIRAMIENFLTLQWRAGALAGTKAENAFFVRVGLGQTMTPQDVLNGFMIVEIGLAVVRPAEFIVLRFSHKMQEA